MKEQLIELAHKKEFISRDRLIIVNDSYYYLWMCELQKWLREKYNIHISIDWNVDLKGNYCFMIDKEDKFCVYDGYKNNNYFDSYEKCLEFALFKALKLIN